MTDEELSRAAREAAALLSDSLPAESLCLLPDSPRFRRKMRRLLHQQRGTNRFARVAALLFLVITVCFGSILALDADALHFIFGWSASDYFDSIWYHFDGEAETSDEKAFCPTYVPDGYDFDSITKLPGGEIYLYTDKSRHYLSFQYLSGKYAEDFILAAGDCDQLEVAIGNLTGVVYLSHSEKKSNDIVWSDAEADVLFCVSAYLDTDELIEVAKGIRKK